ncbi:MAG: hypothetical protein IKV57_07730 [Clostridia bacterium]|nr:hypothetical protein [Clostridia bacterium]
MIRRILTLLPVLGAFVLECLPYGAVCVFAPAPGETLRQTFSYFDPIPFGYANFAPLITGLITAMTVLFALVQTVKPDANRRRTIGMLSAVGAVVSVFPVFSGLQYTTLTGWGITVLLALAAALHLWEAQEREPEKE